MIADQLILYRLPKQGLCYRLASVFEEAKEIKSDKEALKEELLDCIHDLMEISSAHGFYGNLWHCYLTYLLVTRENAYSLGCEIRSDRGGSISEMAERDFSIFLKLFALDFNDLEKCFGMDFSVLSSFDDKNSGGTVFNQRIRDCILDLCQTLEHAQNATEFKAGVAEFYRHYGVGDFGLHKAFRVDEKGNILPISKVSHVCFDDLIGYESQKKRLMENTEAFVRGSSSNNCLLYGDAGTGKSSSIKAVMNQYYDEGLRIIEIYKHQFQLLNTVIAQIKNRNYKFIIYMDDLSFEEFETDYKYLKAVIEGGLEKKPDNVLIYATSNRRHLIRESYADKLDAHDIHKNDTVQEKLSLYHRFGVTIYFGSPDKNEYMDIVMGLKNRTDLSISDEELMLLANRWELSHGGYSGRAARQLIDDLLGKEKI